MKRTPGIDRAIYTEECVFVEGVAMDTSEMQKLMRQGKWEQCHLHYVEVTGQHRRYCCGKNRSLSCDGNKLTCKTPLCAKK